MPSESTRSKLFHWTLGHLAWDFTGARLLEWIKENLRRYLGASLMASIWIYLCAHWRIVGPWVTVLALFVFAGVLFIWDIVTKRRAPSGDPKHEARELVTLVKGAEREIVAAAPIKILPNREHPSGQRFENAGEGSDWCYQSIVVMNEWSAPPKCAHRLTASIQFRSGGTVRTVARPLFVLRDSSGSPHCATEVECLGAANRVELAVCAYSYDYRTYTFKSYPFNPSIEDELTLGRWECEVELKGENATGLARFELVAKDLNHPVEVVWRN